LKRGKLFQTFEEAAILILTLEFWSAGVLECWRRNLINYSRMFFDFLLPIMPISPGSDSSFSITPVLHYSITPKLELRGIQVYLLT
jgi:hypothetical protein